MAEVVYSRHAFRDLERLAEFLLKEAPTAAIAAIDVIRDEELEDVILVLAIRHQREAGYSPG